MGIGPNPNTVGERHLSLPDLDALIDETLTGLHDQPNDVALNQGRIVFLRYQFRVLKVWLNEATREKDRTLTPDD